jgi:hypothetical protein
MRPPESLRPWPRIPDGLPLHRLELPANTDGRAKTFAGPLREGRAAVINKLSGDRLTLEWNARHLPWLGIWLSRGGYQGWHHLALEPLRELHLQLPPAPDIAPQSSRGFWQKAAG